MRKELESIVCCGVCVCMYYESSVKERERKKACAKRHDHPPQTLIPSSHAEEEEAA